MLTIEDIRNPVRKSGFDHVGLTHGGSRRKKPYHANIRDRGSLKAWNGPRRATAEEAAQDYCDRINGSALTIEDIRNPRRKSGFDHVAELRPAANSRLLYYRASRQATKADPVPWWGTSRKTPEEAAQDYCDHINGQRGATVTRLNNAGHATREPAPRDPEVEAALGVLRDHRAQRQGKQGYVYLICEADTPNETIEAVKIGYSTNPLARVGELQAGNRRPLMLYAQKPGTEADERAIHARFIEDNILGEWFRLTPQLCSEFGIPVAEEIAA